MAKDMGGIGERQSIRGSVDETIDSLTVETQDLVRVAFSLEAQLVGQGVKGEPDAYSPDVGADTNPWPIGVENRVRSCLGRVREARDALQVVLQEFTVKPG